MKVILLFFLCVMPHDLASINKICTKNFKLSVDIKYGIPIFWKFICFSITSTGSWFSKKYCFKIRACSVFSFLITKMLLSRLFWSPCIFASHHLPNPSSNLSNTVASFYLFSSQCVPLFSVLCVP